MERRDARASDHTGLKIGAGGLFLGFMAPSAACLRQRWLGRYGLHWALLSFLGFYALEKSVVLHAGHEEISDLLPETHRQSSPYILPLVASGALAMLAVGAILHH